MPTYSKIAMIGTGAIGGYYGACLVRSGADVRFLARTDFPALKENGFRVRMPNETWSVAPVQVFQRPEEVGTVELVIVSLKATANAALTALIPPLLHEGTAILTLENGLGSDELLAAEFGPERVMGGLCFIAVNRTAPGQIHCIHPGSISFGEFQRPASERLREIAALFSRAGIKSQVSEDLAALRWKKLVWNIPFNGLSIAAGGVTTDRILGALGLENEVLTLMAEVIDAAAKLGHVIPREFIDHQVEITRPMGPYKPSSLIDFLAGREVEVEAIWGEPLRRAKAAGAQMPRLESLYATLLEKTQRPAR